ncbi:subtilisin-like protease SBT4.3 [Aristolochia californica]|uniref:subtilisin-like protease SBT4.3 n=1 Tax=Aristolochia californica TaxID=171875 RepID=UPI0035DD7580
MANLCRVTILLTVLLVALSCHCLSLHTDRKVYIVYMGALPRGQYEPRAHHQSILQQVLRNSSVSDSLIYSYTRSFNGFVAHLTDEEQKRIANMEGVVSIFPSSKYKLLTTRSWDFIGFTRTVERMSAVESDIIIGVLDGGIWPESESFTDQGLSHPPKKWKGICQSTTYFSCNNKVIGARFYEETGDSPRDKQGHGTHTASTAAGREVEGASLYGLGRGTARGGVPSARLAIYKVCAEDGCLLENILAGFDDAIADGVDIISVSLGPSATTDYTVDPIAIGSFHAMKKGILTSQAGGNSGPGSASMGSAAPWLLSVAATTIDRGFVSKVKLRDGKTFVGNAVNTFTMNGSSFPLIYGGDATNGCSAGAGRFCYEECLNKTLVEGRIILCEETFDVEGPAKLGALGAIIEDGKYSDCPESFPLPATLLPPRFGDRIKSYINSSKDPRANIFRTMEIKDSRAPVIASFSSRGPNSITSDILKPDIAAPGMAILAAYSLSASISGSYRDKRFSKYNIMSGTSMSCPHVAGAAAYVKSFHPTWSPAAIKSALMTTASAMSPGKHKDVEFAYGAGLVNPVKATDPGLVYDAQERDYIQMLCNQGYEAKHVRLISGDNSSCPHGPVGTVRDLNYPAMAVKITEGSHFSTYFLRTVTNVGSHDSTYKATISPRDSAIKVTITPDILQFSSKNDKQPFVVTISGGTLKSDSLLSFQLVWSDTSHSVSSPIVLFT